MVRRVHRCLAAVVVLLGGCRAGATTAPEDRGAPVASPADANAPPAAIEPGWTRVTEADGILVTSRPSEHSELPILRGVGRLDAPLLTVLAVITDAERHDEWLYSCSASALIEQTSESTGIVYNRTAAPWPVPDRDVVLESRVELVDGEREAIVRFSAAEHPKRPPTDGVVRITYLRGHYHLWAEDDGHTRIEYQVDSDPGGNLPAWLATRGTRDIPLETLQGLRSQLVRTRGLYEDRIAEFRRTLLADPG